MSDIVPQQSVDLTRLRDAVQSYHKVRGITQSAVLGEGTGRLPPADLAAFVKSRRDESLETKAARDYRAIFELILGRAPTPPEIEAGLPVGAQVDPAKAQLVEAGVFSTSNLFEYLKHIEDQIQQEAGIGESALWRATKRWGPLALAAGAVGAGAFYVWSQRKRPPMPGEPGAPPAPEPEPDDDEEDEE